MLRAEAQFELTSSQVATTAVSPQPLPSSREHDPAAMSDSTRSNATDVGIAAHAWYATSSK